MSQVLEASKERPYLSLRLMLDSALIEIGYQGVCKGDLTIHAMDTFAGMVTGPSGYSILLVPVWRANITC